MRVIAQVVHKGANRVGDVVHLQRAKDKVRDPDLGVPGGASAVLSTIGVKTVNLNTREVSRFN